MGRRVLLRGAVRGGCGVDLDKNILFGEYKCIRDEIMSFTQLRNTLTTFTITAVIAILAAALELGNPFISLCAYLILIPVHFRVIYYGYAAMKLAAYQIVYLEPLLPEVQWETLNAKIMPGLKRSQNPTYKISKEFRYHEFTFLSVGVSVVFYYMFFSQPDLVWSWYHLLLSIPLLIDLLIVLSTLHGRKTENIKAEYLELWKRLKKRNPHDPRQKQDG